MAVSFSAQTVIDRAVRRCRIPTPGTGEFLTAAQALDMVTDAVERLSGLLIRSFGDSYFVSTTTLNTVASTATVALPSNLATLQSLHLVIGTDAYRLERFDVGEYDPEARAWSANELPRFRIEGNTLVFTPMPNAVYSLRLAYSTGIFITSAADVIAGQIGWKDWLTYDVCEQIREEEQKDGSEFTAKKMKAEADILAQGQQRDRFSTVQVRDVRSVSAVASRLFRGRLV